MPLKSSKNLQALNHKGWIPGPEEEKTAYLSRIEALNHFFSYPPSDVDHFLTDRDWRPAQKKTEELYDFSSDWIVAHYSNRNLTFFQAAATWISEKQNIRIPLIQLRKKFETGNFLRLYKREEVLSHEAVHAARMQFDEPLFEEIFAYKTSPYFWRRFFGPLFQSPWEATLFIALLFIPIAIEVALFFYIDLGPFFWAAFLPFLFAGALVIRLLFFHFTLRIALHNLKSFLKDPKKNWAVAFRLKDREIFQFAYRKKKRLPLLIKNQASFRWKLLIENYFKL